MFPSKNPLFCLLEVVLVGAAVIACLIVTGNPLALLGLCFMPDTPPLIPENYQQVNAQATSEPRSIGFTADMDD